MRMSRAGLLLKETFVCQHCLLRGNARVHLLKDGSPFKAVRPLTQRNLGQFPQLASRQSHQINPRAQTRSLTSDTNRTQKKSSSKVVLRRTTHDRNPAGPDSAATQSVNLISATQGVATRCQELIQSEVVPDETDILEVLQQGYAVSEIIVFGKTDISIPDSDRNLASQSSATSSLLNLQEESNNGIAKLSVPSDKKHTIEKRQQASRNIMDAVHSLLIAPYTFISPAVLEMYVRIACLLGNPETLPEIFSLYANKPTPKAGTSPVQYSSPKPKAASNAIPKHLADAALESAIVTRNLGLALSIIDTTVKAPAWLRRKLLKEASLPILASSTLPFVAYVAATAFSEYQNTVTPSLASGLAFTGIMTYFVVTGTFGYVALTTYNDHHRRVRWRHIPLTERWLREDERAMFDRIALGWGFKEQWRWGEEEGADWEAIKEFCGRRDMIVDRTETLEGME